MTEALCWILNTHPVLEQAFLKRVGVQVIADEPFEWQSQVSIRQGYIDMVARSATQLVVFEHKTFSTLHHEQLSRYRAWGDTQQSTPCRVVLITGSTRQFSEDADLCLLWADVFSCFESLHLEHAMMRDAFLDLLSFEGFGPPACVSHEGLLHYRASLTLERELDALMEEALLSDWTWAYTMLGVPLERRTPYRRTTGRGTLKIRDGRMGIDLDPLWGPGVFVGVLLDGSDHRVEWSEPSKGPDMCLIISLTNEVELAALRADFLKSDEYDALLQRLSAEVEDTRFHLVDHLHEHPDPNPWHILHIRRPLLDVWSGTSSFQEQKQRFLEEAQAMMEWVCRGGELARFTHRT